MIKYINYRNEHYDILKEMIIALYKEDPEGEEINEVKITRTINEYKNNPSKLRILLIECDGKIVGYAIIVFYWSNEYGGDILNIDELFINEAYRGQGIATEFIGELKKIFDDIVALQLEVTPSNNRVMKYYNRLGFNKTSNTHMIYII